MTIFRTRKGRGRGDHLDRAKEVEQKTDEQEREIHELLQESQEVNAENARIREENHFEDLYAWLFRGEVPPASPRRKRGISWLNG
jgi:hypothetical protein